LSEFEEKNKLIKYQAYACIVGGFLVLYGFAAALQNAGEYLPIRQYMTLNYTFADATVRDASLAAALA
jgi:hypothetical protein